MKSPALPHRRTTSVALAGLVSAGIAVAALVGPVGAATPTSTEAPSTSTSAPTTETPTTETPTTETPTTETPTTTVEPLDEGGTIGTTYMQGCTVEIPVTVEAGGTYRLTVWDEGNQIGEVSHSFHDGESAVLEYPLTHAPAQIVSPGLGYELYGESGEMVDETDPDTPGANVMANCTSSTARAQASAGGQANPAQAVKTKPTFTG